MKNPFIRSSRSRVVLAVGVALGVTLVLAPVAPEGASAAVGPSGSLVLWNRFEHQTNPLASEVGPDVQLASYRYPDWEEAMIVPGRFGNGLFVNHGTDEGWNGDGANFFAADLRKTTLTPRAGTIELWFTFQYDSSEYNHALFFDSRSAFAGHFTRPEWEMHSGAPLAAGWNGWDYGTEGKRFFLSVGERRYTAVTPDYSAAPGGLYDFHPGDTVHFAFVWDLGGIEGGRDTARIYIDGRLAGAGQSTWSDLAFDPYLYIGATPNEDPWDSHYNAVRGVTDNIKIYDVARTDFSDRSQEVPWTVRGFEHPVVGTPAVNRVKAGATVPLRFEIFDGTREVTSPTAVSSFTAAWVHCRTGAVQALGPITRAGGTKLRYDADTGKFVVNWKTPSSAGSCYTVTMTTQVGAALSARFRLT